MNATNPSGSGGGGGGGGGGSSSSGGGGGGGPCGACKFLRRKCVLGCIFAPYFDSEQGAAHFAAVHKVFGASNVSKLLLHIPVHKRLDAVVTICYEAQARLRDPVYGCVAHIFALQQQVCVCVCECAWLIYLKEPIIYFFFLGKLVLIPFSNWIQNPFLFLVGSHRPMISINSKSHWPKRVLQCRANHELIISGRAGLWDLLVWFLTRKRIKCIGTFIHMVVGRNKYWNLEALLIKKSCGRRLLYANGFCAICACLVLVLRKMVGLLLLQ